MKTKSKGSAPECPHLYATHNLSHFYEKGAEAHWEDAFRECKELDEIEIPAGVELEGDIGVLRNRRSQGDWAKNDHNTSNSLGRKHNLLSVP